MSEREEKTFCDILIFELEKALGCTEPIAIAYTASVARRALGKIPDQVVVRCSGNIIKNAKSNKMGVKDIIKVECPIENLDLDILGFIDHNITVNIIKDEKIVEKRILKLPKQITNVIKCKNPRCITSIEQGLDQVFILADPEKEVYRCKYCEEKYRGKRNK